jgi:hypothetical protein
MRRERRAGLGHEQRQVEQAADRQPREDEAPAREMVHHVGVRGEEPEVHRDAEVDEEEEARGDEVRTCEHREQAEGEPQRQPSRQWREEQLAPVGRGEGTGDDDVRLACCPPHGVAQRNVRTDSGRPRRMPAALYRPAHRRRRRSGRRTRARGLPRRCEAVRGQAGRPSRRQHAEAGPGTTDEADRVRRHDARDDHREQRQPCRLLPDDHRAVPGGHAALSAAPDRR